MMKFYGVNFGGFLSQIEEKSEDHYASFLTEQDFKRVQRWGFNTIRLPIDYFELFDFTQNEIMIEKKAHIVDKCVIWAQEYGLKLILNLHKAPGHSFDHNESDANDLWDPKTESQQKFFEIWKKLSERFGKFDNVLFEVMNEPTAPFPEQWNELVEKTIPIIRKNARNNYIVVESNMWGQVDTFSDLKKFKDDKIIYSFHFYQPILVTHQKAEWFRLIQEYYPGYVEYPGEIPNLDPILREMKKQESEHDFFIFKNQMGKWDLQRIEAMWQPVLDFQRKHQVPVLLGEFGCIGYAKPEVRSRWLGDIMTLIKKYDINFTYWNYKNLHFGLIDNSLRFQKNANYNDKRIDTRTLEILQSK